MMKTTLQRLRRRLRLPFWHRADIEAEIAGHLEEAAAELSDRGTEKAAAEQTALERFGDLDSLAESLHTIHKGWTGGATVQQRFAKVLTIAVILACILAVPLVPPRREAARNVSSTAFGERAEFLPTQAELERAAQKHPRNVYIELALAENTFGSLVPESEQDAVGILAGPSRLRTAASQYPEEPAAHVRLALLLLADIELEREEQWGMHRGGFSPKERSVEETACLDEAIKHLRIASALARENSAPDFFLAYALFAKREDSQAEKALRAALAKPAWSLYTKEITQALLTLCEESGTPALGLPGAMMTGLMHDFDTSMASISLARLLTGLGEKSRRAGDHNRAVFYYECSTHLGLVMLDGADAIDDVLYASIVPHIPSQPFISESETQALESLHLSREEEIAREREIQTRNLCAYFVAQGRGDLADAYTRDLERALRFDEDAKVITRKMMSQFFGAFASRSMLFAAVSWLLLSYALVLLIITGFLSLILRSWKKQGTAPLWHWWEWAVLMVAVFVPTYAGGFLFFPTFEEELMTWDYPELVVIVAAIIAISTPLLLIIVPIVGGLRKRRRQPTEERLGRLQACLASFRALLPATFALLLVVALALTIPAQLTLERWAELQKRILQHGEVEYWNIGSLEAEPTLGDDVTFGREE